jgi:LmbE family N-acetylglucosaminyl deacetylase
MKFSSMKKRIVGIINRLFLAVGLVLVLQPFTQEAVAGKAPTCSKGVTMNFVAHEDDDLLFQSPDLIHDIQNGRCVRTVFLTAGDAGENATYWMAREAGARAAYANMSGVNNSWKKTDAGISGHPIPLYTLSGKPTVSLAFLRLPDGNGDGSGFATYGNQSLQKLWLGSISAMSAVDATSSYTRTALIDTLLALMNGLRPSVIHSQDFNGVYNDGDHSDHHTAANFARAAHQKYSQSHVMTGYQGYGIAGKPENVFGTDLTGKKNAFYAYGNHDSHVCNSDISCQGSYYEFWLKRQYTTASEIGPLTNVAALSSVTASSEDPNYGQLATKAIDGIATGYPVDFTKEWATVGGGAGSWLNLSWSSPKNISRIVLYDRPNADDQITSAMITFSDGSIIFTGTLNNDGSGVIINFATKSVIGLQLDILSVSPSTFNIGLAEIEVF